MLQLSICLMLQVVLNLTLANLAGIEPFISKPPTPFEFPLSQYQ